MNGFAIHVSAPISFRDVSARYQTQASEISVFSMTFAASGQYSAGEGEVVGALARRFPFSQLPMGKKKASEACGPEVFQSEIQFVIGDSLTWRIQPS
jgi:hypothetical protein